MFQLYRPGKGRFLIQGVVLFFALLSRKNNSVPNALMAFLLLFLSFDIFTVFLELRFGFDRSFLVHNISNALPYFYAPLFYPHSIPYVPVIVYHQLIARITIAILGINFFLFAGLFGILRSAGF